MSANQPERRRIAWDLLAAVLAYVLLRALVLYTNFDALTLWMYELYPMGTMAEFLRRGVDYPLHFYYDNAAGQLLSGFLTLPCFVVFGPTYLALKLVPFAMGVCVLVLAWRWLCASHGRLAANLAAWSLVLAPTTYFKYSLTNSGNHFENLLFSMLAIVAFARLAHLGVSRGRLFAFGLACGFALFVFLGALIPVGILCALHLCRRGVRATLADLPWLGAGFLLGELPLLLLNLSTGGRGLGFLGAKFAAEDSAAAGGSVLGRMADYLGGTLPSAATYPAAAGVPSAVFGACFFALLALTWIAALPCAWRALRDLLRQQPSEDWLLLLYVAYVPLSALAYGLSNLRLTGHSGNLAYGNYRYYLPLFLYGMLAAAVLAARAWRAHGARRAAALLVPLGVLLPGLANFGLVDWSGAQTGLGSRYSGYDLSKAARGLLSARNALEREEQLRHLRSFPPLLRASVTRAMGFNLALLQIGPARKADAREWTLDLCALLSDWPEDLQHELARGAGIGLRFATGGADAHELLPPLRRTIAHAQACPARLADLLEGLASANPALPLASQIDAQSASTNGLVGKARLREVPEDDVRALVRGQGLLFGQLLCRGIASDLHTLETRRAELAPELQADFYEGLGEGCALEGGAPAGFTPPAEQAAAFRTGLERERLALEPH